MGQYQFLHAVMARIASEPVDMAPGYINALLNAQKAAYNCTAAHMQDHTPIRPGVGQYHFLHALMARGAIELDKLVPGFTDALLERGAVKTDWLKHSQMASPA